MTGTSSSLRRHVHHGSLPFHACRLIEVTARLRAGAALPPATWFPAPLDGILAAAERRRRLGARYGAAVDHHTSDLPLTSTARGCGDPAQPRWTRKRWMWAATCAWWDPAAAVEDVRWSHKRAWSDLDAAAAGTSTPANPDVGRYKPSRIPVVVTVASTLRWLCIGDRAGIDSLLDGVDSIGKKRNSGEGQVIEWSTSDIGPPDWHAILWHPDGRISRPVPARHAATLGIPDAHTVTIDAYRPPYWRPAITPSGYRQLVEVIAPTTARPAEP